MDKPVIANLDNLLDRISEEDIHLKYDPKELNDNGIYPEIWHIDNSPDKAYNERHILEDLQELKTIIKQANNENDYIFVFAG